MDPRKLPNWSVLIARQYGVRVNPHHIPIKRLADLTEPPRGFLFAREYQRCLWVDYSLFYNDNGGIRQKPPPYQLTPEVRDRFLQRHYRHWYYLTEMTLYPLHPTNVQRFLQSFYFTIVPDRFYRPEIIPLQSIDESA